MAINILETVYFNTCMRVPENYGHEYYLDPGEASKKLLIEVTSACVFNDAVIDVSEWPTYVDMHIAVLVGTSA